MNRVRTPPVASAVAGAAPPAGVATAGRQGGGGGGAGAAPPAGVATAGRQGGGGGGAGGGAPRVVIVHVCFGLDTPDGDMCGNTLFEHMNGRWYCMRCGMRHRGSWDVVAHFLDRFVVVDAVASEHFQGIDDLQVFLRVAIALRRNVYTGQLVSGDGRIADAFRMVVLGEWV